MPIERTDPLIADMFIAVFEEISEQLNLSGSIGANET